MNLPAVLIAAIVGQAAFDPGSLVRRLGSTDAAEQANAASGLRDLGREALPALLAARSSADEGLRLARLSSFAPGSKPLR